MRTRPLFLVAVMLCGSRAHAYFEEFLGWSKDGQFYAATSAGTDDMQSVLLCPVGDALPQSWPKGAPGLDDEGGGTCAKVCDAMNEDCAKAKKKAMAWAPLSKASSTGPRGEAIALRKLGETGLATVTLKGKAIARLTFEIQHRNTLEIRGVYWAPQNAAVAIEFGATDDGNHDGWGPTHTYEVVTLGGPPPTTDRGAAWDANRRAMKAYKAKDWATAAKELRASIAADGEWVQPHYNLACVAALQHDSTVAIAELEWLKRSKDYEAKARLDKGKKDPDLASVRDDPRARAALDLGPAAPAPAPAPKVAARPGDGKKKIPDFAREGGLDVILWKDEADADEDAAKLLAKISGLEHECEPQNSYSLWWDLFPDHPGAERLLGNIGDGIAVTDPSGRKPIVRGDLGECVGSMTQLLGLGAAQVVPDADAEIVAHMTSGGRGNFQEGILVYKRVGKKLVIIFNGTLATTANERERKGKLSFASDGTIRYREPGRKAEKVLRWNETKHTFE